MKIIKDRVFSEKEHLLHFFPEPSCIFNDVKEIVRANKLFYEQFQEPEFESFIYKESRHVFDAHFEKAKQGETEQFIIHLYNDNKQLQPFEVSFIPFTTECAQVFLQCFIKNYEEVAGRTATWSLDFTNNQAEFTDDFCRMLQVSPLYLRNEFDMYKKMIDERDYPFIIEAIGRSKRGVPYHYEYTVKRLDNTSRLLKDRGKIVFNNQGVPERLIIETVDVTPKNVGEKIEKTLKEGRLRKALDQAAIVAIADLSGRIREVNDHFCKIAKYSREELIGQNVRILNSGFHSKQFFKEMWNTIKEGNVWRGEIRNKSKEGNIFWVRQTIIPILDEEKKPVRFMAINFDITEQKDTQDMIKQISHIDPLTRLPNEKKFEEVLEAQIHAVSNTDDSLALYFLSLHQFHKIIETFGHKEADRILVQVSQYLQAFAPEHIYRIEVDKFAILIGGMDEETGSKLAAIILERFLKPFTLGDIDIYLSAHIGLSYFSKKRELSIQQEANVALTQAIKAGKNRYTVYKPGMDTVHIHTFREFMIGNDLHAALEKQQISVQYQPQVDSFTGQIVGAEALLRWDHPEWGEISPDEFIPVAEEKGLIHDLGYYTIETVCDQLDIWKKSRMPEICGYINLSVHQLMNEDFAEQVERILTKVGLEPRFLGFEIKDFTIVKKNTVMLKNLTRLKELGMSISIDNLGIGFLSASCLDLFDSLKIKRDFMIGFEDENYEGEQMNLLRSFIVMAHDLKKMVIAEGVETVEQRTILRNCKCDIIQGFLYSRPLDAKQFKVHLRQGYIKANTGLDDDSFENRREYFRIQLNFPIEAKMTISRIKGNAVNLKNTVALIEDIGPGGLRFLSTLNLPVNDQITLLFEVKLLGRKLDLFGYTRWKREVRQGIYEYGFMFQISEEDRESMIDLLNKVTISLKKQRSIPDTDVVTENKFRYLLTCIEES